MKRYKQHDKNIITCTVLVELRITFQHELAVNDSDCLCSQSLLNGSI